jgi:RNA polymerase sigma-70 factor (ECF subfamily)
MVEPLDLDLLEDFRLGHKHAFDKVFEIFYSELYVFGMKLIGDEDISKDIVIEVMTSLFKLHKRFDTGVNIRAFLYISTRNRCFDYLRSAKRLQKREQGFIHLMKESKETINDQIDGVFLKKVYHSSLEMLPSQTRKVIQLIFEEQLTYPQIAEQLKISVNTVKGLRKYGLKKIENTITDRGLSTAIVKWMNCLMPVSFLYLIV